jgi:hypothetical protein
LNKIKTIHTLDDEVSLIKIMVGHLVLEKGRLHKHGDSLLLLVKLNEVIAIYALNDVVSLREVVVGEVVLHQGGLDEHWDAFSFKLYKGGSWNLYFLGFSRLGLGFFGVVLAGGGCFSFGSNDLGDRVKYSLEVGRVGGNDVVCQIVAEN